MEELLELVKENPSLIKEIVEGYLNKYKSAVYDLCNICLDIYGDYADNTKLFKTNARAKMNQFEAYKEAGFSDEQSMTLLVAGIQSFEKAITNYSNNIKTNSK